jgi:hypothetical protein
MSPIRLHHVAGINLLLAEVPQEDYSELIFDTVKQASTGGPVEVLRRSPRRRMAISQLRLSWRSTASKDTARQLQLLGMMLSAWQCTRSPFSVASKGRRIERLHRDDAAPA